MTLLDWLTETKTSFAAFARTLGVSGAKVVERYAKHQRIPEPEIMRQIVAATGGRVTPNDFYLGTGIAGGDDKIGHAPTLAEGPGGVSAEPAGVVSTMGEAA